MTARPSAAGQPQPETARSSPPPAWLALADPTKARREGEHPRTVRMQQPVRRVQLERAPPQADPTMALGRQVRPMTARPSAQEPARLAARPRSEPGRLHWKAARPVHPMKATRRVTTPQERQAHPRCLRLGWPVQPLRPNRATAG
jgi:hypothetical protein